MHASLLYIALVRHYKFCRVLQLYNIMFVFTIETLLFTLCLIGAICLLLSRQNFIMQHHRKMEAADATESLKYIHPNNPHLVSVANCATVNSLFGEQNYCQIAE